MSVTRVAAARSLRSERAVKHSGSFTRWVLIYIAVSVLLTAVSLVVGSSSVRISLGWLISPDALSNAVLWDIRLPRTLGAWSAGALLGLAGAIAQSVFRNPLADPYLLGSATGAALGVTVSLLVSDASLTSLAWLGQVGLTGAAFVGACAGVALTLALSRGVLQTQSLLLAGVVVAYLLGAITSLLCLRSQETWRAMQSFLLGSTGFLGWRAVALMTVVFAVSLPPSGLLSRGLDALTLGEDTALSIGIPLGTLRLALLGILSLTTAASVSQLGVVGFVGLVAPHLVRESVHVNSRQLVIAAPLCGGALLQAADILSRWIIRPSELPVGIITACLGGAYLVTLLWRKGRRE
ncbi:MAG: FecCD family ABC transporter permease [Solirubrobacteraceae bacterium]